MLDLSPNTLTLDIVTIFGKVEALTKLRWTRVTTLRTVFKARAPGTTINYRLVTLEGASRVRWTTFHAIFIIVKTVAYTIVGQRFIPKLSLSLLMLLLPAVTRNRETFHKKLYLWVGTVSNSSFCYFIRISKAIVYCFLTCAAIRMISNNSASKLTPSVFK